MAKASKQQLLAIAIDAELILQYPMVFLVTPSLIGLTGNRYIAA